MRHCWAETLLQSAKVSAEVSLTAKAYLECLRDSVLTVLIVSTESDTEAEAGWQDGHSSGCAKFAASK